MNNFNKFGFKKFINLCLNELNFIKPTIVQEKVIPLLLKNKNIICKTNTGTGKTLSFCLPILNNINFFEINVQCIIIAPTRELVKQIYDNIYFFKKFEKNLHVNYFIGGKDINNQIKQLKQSKPQIIVSTPMRLKYLFEKKSLNLLKLTTFIIDECDMIFDLGFIENINFILNKINYNVKISVFSATISNELKYFLIKYLKSAHYLELNKNEIINKNISHILIPIKYQMYQTILLKILKTFDPYLCLIFVNKKTEISKYYDLLLTNNYSVTQLHSGLKPRLRDKIVKEIKKLKYKYIIASDVVSRGIDFIGVSHVISINLPNYLEYYIHRSGRTGRSNYTGYSYIIYNTKNFNLIKKLISKGIVFEIKKWNKQKKMFITKSIINKRKKQNNKLINNKNNNNYYKNLNLIKK